MALPEHPLRVKHTLCDAEWDLYCIEWPPRVIYCTECRAPLKLIAFDPYTRRTAYREI